MTETTQKFKRQLPKNARMAALSFVTYAITAVWLTPYLLKHLGPAAYGLIPIAALFTQYVAIITSNISSSVNRFLTIELNKPDGKPNAVFNSTLALYSLLVVVQIPLFVLGLVYADKLFSIPRELRIDALLLLGCSALGFLVSFIGGVFWVAAFSKNRIDVSSSVHAGRLVARLLLLVLLFATLGPRLRYIGFIDLGLQVLSSLIAMGFFRKFCPVLSLDLRQIEWRLMLPVFSMSFWSLLYSFGGLLFLRTDIWIINRFISPFAAGQYAAILVVANFIRQLVGQGTRQIAPVVMQYWAKNEKGELERLLGFSIRSFAVILTVPIAVLCLFGGQVLELWLGADFVGYGPLLSIMVVHLIANCASDPLVQMPIVTNSLPIPTVFRIAMGFLNFVGSFVLGVQMGMGTTGVAWATAITLTLDSLFLAYNVASRLDSPKVLFLKPLFMCLVVEVVLGFIALGNGRLGLSGIEFSGVWDALLKSTYVGLVAAICGWIFFLSGKDRGSVIRFAKNLFVRHRM